MVELLIDAGEQRVVVPHHLDQAVAPDRLEMIDAAGVNVANDRADVLGALEVLEQNQIEDALALPEVVLWRLDERPQQPLQENDEAAEDTAMAAERELVVPVPQPSPVRQIAGRLAEELLDRNGWRHGARFRSAATRRLRRHDPTLRPRP